jgi:hypothetical protein
MAARWRWAAGLIVAWSSAAAPAAGTAVMKASLGVGATVVAGCHIVPRQAAACAPRPPAGTVAPPQPLVSFSRDPRTGALTETVAF